MTRRLSPDQQAALLDEYDRGIPIAAIAAKYGVDGSYPSILAGRRGKPRRMSAAHRDALSVSHSQRRIQK